MAKTISISLDHEYMSGRGGEAMSVKEALKWVEEHTGGEDENGGETGPKYSAGDLVVYAVRRMMALKSDKTRHDKGKLATHLYAPRLDTVKNAPKNLATLVEGIDKVEAGLTKAAPKAPKAKPRKAA